jgi:tRNA-splicing ligase RtcB
MTAQTVKIFGEPEERTVKQLMTCAAEFAPHAVLCADAHVGYSQPIGAAIAYEDRISPSGVGYDIGCGNKAARTTLKRTDVDIVRMMDEIKEKISFGIGRRDGVSADHLVIDKIAHADFAPQRLLLDLAAKQLGTVGGGNHYVDLLVDEEDYLWVGVHFGSRGFGHKTATGFLALAHGDSFGDRASEGGMDSAPILFDTRTTLGQDYIAAMILAGNYANAGRDVVVARVLDILDTGFSDEVHNHHNYAWQEEHFGGMFWVVRKGCTPAYPGQQGFVGGSMGDISVILEGVDSSESKLALYSTVHGAGRIMSRTQAAGKRRWKGGVRKTISKGLVDWDQVNRDLKERGIVIRGGDADEAPQAYRPLAGVLEKHTGTIKVLHILQPVGVAMAGWDTPDPYRD